MTTALILLTGTLVRLVLPFGLLMLIGTLVQRSPSKADSRM